MVKGSSSTVDPDLIETTALLEAFVIEDRILQNVAKKVHKTLSYRLMQ